MLESPTRACVRARTIAPTPGRQILGPGVNDHEKSPVSIMEIPHPWVIEIGL